MPSTSRPPDNGSRALATILRAWPVLAAIIGSSAATYGWLQNQLDAHIEDVVDPKIETSNDAFRAWAVEHQKSFDELSKRTTVCKDSLFVVYWFYVGDKAADAEPNRNLKSQAATQARDRFEKYVGQGDTYDTAFRKTLETRPPR